MTFYSQTVDAITAISREIGEAGQGIMDSGSRSMDTVMQAQAHMEALNASAEADRKTALAILKAEFDQDLKRRRDAQNQVRAFESQLAKQGIRRHLSKLAEGDEDVAFLDEAAARELVAKIQDDSFLGMLKRLLSLSGYKPNRAMRGKLFHMIDSAMAYYFNLDKELDGKYMADRGRIEGAYLSKLEANKARFEATQRSASERLSGEIAVLKGLLDSISGRSEVARINGAVRDAFGLLGAGAEGWQTYVPADTMPGEILLGRAMLPNPGGEAMSQAVPALAAITCYNEAANGFALPLTLPTNRPALLYGHTDGEDVAALAAVYRDYVARLVRFMPPRSFRAEFIDHKNASLHLGGLTALTEDPEEALCRCSSTAQEVAQCLSRLTDQMRGTLAQLAKGYDSIYAYNAANPGQIIPHTLVVVHNYPAGLGGQGLSDLALLIENSAKCGISVFISHKGRDVLDEHSQKLVSGKGFARLAHIGGQFTFSQGGAAMPFKHHPTAVPRAYLEAAYQAYCHRDPLQNAFSAYFSPHSPPQPALAAKGLDIPLLVTGDNQLLSLRIGHSLAAHGLLTGTTSSGKTTTIHAIIASAILHYPPEELELWLADFKITEFAFYREHCPAHVRYILANRSAEAGFGLLDKIEAVWHARAKLFDAAGVGDYEAYRSAHSLPRIFVIIDEFHILAQCAAAEPEYKIKMENIFSEVRSFGITLLVCDQMISQGLSGLSEKARRQIAARLAMRNDAEEVKATLGVESAELSDTLRAQIHENTKAVSGGMLYRYEQADPKNPMANIVDYQTCRSLNIIAAEREVVVEAVNRRAGDFNRPKQFFIEPRRKAMDMADIAVYEEEKPLPPGGGHRLFIGTPMGLDAAFCMEVNTGPGENILLAGAEESMKKGILWGVAQSCIQNGWQLVVLASRRDSFVLKNRAFFQQLEGAQLYSRFGDICRYIGQASNRLNALFPTEGEDAAWEDVSALAPQEKTLVMLVGIDGIHAQMSESRLSQAEAWARPDPAPARSDPARPTGPQPAPSPATTGAAAATAGRDTGGSPEALSGFDASMSALLADIRQRAQGADAVEIQSIPDRQAGEEPGWRGYNAVADLSNLLRRGPAMGLHAMAVIEKPASLRELKLGAGFDHRIVLPMAAEAAGQILTKNRIMKTLTQEEKRLCAVYERDGVHEWAFRPYLPQEEV